MRRRRRLEIIKKKGVGDSERESKFSAQRDKFSPRRDNLSSDWDKISHRRDIFSAQRDFLFRQSVLTFGGFVIITYNIIMLSSGINIRNIKIKKDLRKTAWHRFCVGSNMLKDKLVHSR